MSERLSDERVRTYVMWGTDPDVDMDRHVASLAREVLAARKLRADLLALLWAVQLEGYEGDVRQAFRNAVRLLEADDE